MYGTTLAHYVTAEKIRSAAVHLYDLDSLDCVVSNVCEMVWWEIRQSPPTRRSGITPASRENRNIGFVIEKDRQKSAMRLA